MPAPRIVVAAVGAVAAAGFVWAVLPDRDVPSPDASAAPMVQVSVPPLSAAAKAGEAAFNSHCADCHGENAAGRQNIAPPLVHVIYEPSHHGDAAFFLAAQRGVRAHHWPFGDMPPVEGVTQQDVAAIVTYVRTLQQANGIN